MTHPREKTGPQGTQRPPLQSDICLDEPSKALTAQLDTPGDGTDTKGMEQKPDALHKELTHSLRRLDEQEREIRDVTHRSGCSCTNRVTLDLHTGLRVTNSKSNRLRARINEGETDIHDSDSSASRLTSRGTVTPKPPVDPPPRPPSPPGLPLGKHFVTILHLFHVP